MSIATDNWVSVSPGYIFGPLPVRDSEAMCDFVILI